MKKIIYSLMAFALIAVTSCESMLEIPQKGVVGYDEFYDSDDDARAALASMYANYLQNVAGTEGIDNPEQVMLNYSADDILAAGGHYQDHAPFRYFCEFSYDNANGTLKSAYQRYMFSIYHANLIISNFTKENRTEAEPKHTSDFVNQAVAEARVMRAYLHMMLALSWYNPPIVDRIYDMDEDRPASSKDQATVLQWVIDECQKAIASNALPVRKGQGDKDATTRMSLGFAQFVAGKAAVFMGKMDVARTYLGALIESNNYGLVPSEEYWINFHVAGDGSVEKIFEPNFLEDPAFTNNAWGSGAPIQRGRWMVANVFCWRTDALASQPQVHDGFQGWNGGAIQEDFAKKFLEHDGNSPRRRACFLTGEEWLYEMDWASDVTPMCPIFGDGMGEESENEDGTIVYIKPNESKDADGNTIYTDKSGNRVDKDGYLLEEKKDKDGKIELDDNGKPTWVQKKEYYKTKQSDPYRGISSASGVHSHGQYFEWKHMVFVKPPQILTGKDKKYPSDHVTGLGPASNQKNFNVARYAEALLLYAEACIGSADAAKGLAALQAVQERSGSGKVSTELNIQNVMEEKQYEMWFENCRFHDLVRWSQQEHSKAYVDLDKVFNQSGIHKDVPTVFDEYFTKGKPGYKTEHKLFTTYSSVPGNSDFQKNKHEYFPFPRDYQNVNPNLVNAWGAWASAQ